MLITLLILLLTSNALTTNRDISIYYSRVVIVSLLSVSYILVETLSISALEKGIGLYGGLFNLTSVIYVFAIFVCLITSIILVITGFYPRKLYYKELSYIYNIIFSKLNYNKNAISNKLGNQYRIIEYALITIFVISGGIFLMTSADLISIFLSIELQSYGLYIISTIYRDSELATGSGLVYFLLGGLSSCFILLGSALIYTLTGTTNLDNIYMMINIFDNYTYPNSMIILTMTDLVKNFVFWDKIYYIQLAIIVMVVGFLFKVSAAPFHFWSPDVYDGIPTVVTTFVAIVAKISIFTYLLDFVYQTQSSLFDFSWTNILVLSSLLSLIIGSLLGLTQFRIKRLFAYSTISHVGFILLALSINTPESIQSYIFYIVQYSITNLNAFIILLAIGYTLFIYVYKNDNDEQLLDKDNSPVQLVSQLKGYFYINPFIAISFCITLFSFVGIPPIVGFFAKQKVLSAALDQGYTFMALIAILTSVAGAGYYLNLIKNMFFFKHDYNINPSLTSSELSIVAYKTKHTKNILSELKQDTLQSEKVMLNINNITIISSLSTIISVITLMTVLFIYIPDESFNLVNIITLNIFDI